MPWINAPDTEFLLCRQISSDHQIEMGVYPVIYGMRVRCGFLGSFSVELDWCAGGSDTSLKVLYSLCYKIIGDRLHMDRHEIFDRQVVPSYSNIKPWTLDRDFTARLAALAGPVEPISLPPVHKIRADFFQMGMHS